MANTDLTPTVVIGVGGAGVGVVKRTYEAVKQSKEWGDTEEDDSDNLTTEDYFKFYAFDSNQDSLYELDELGITTTQIQDDKHRFDANKAKYPYLTEEFEHSEEGARRKRPIGRYKFDNRSVPNFEYYMGNINDIIEYHVDYVQGFDEVNRLNIFFVHSLPGGTGSGTFPLFAGMLNDIADDLDPHNVDTYIAGIGVMSEMEHKTLAEKPGFRPNTYAALNDIDKLLDDDIETLPVYSKAELERDVKDRMENPVETDLDVSDPLDDYWLVGMNESLVRTDEGKAQLESYIEEIDNTVAEFVLGMARRNPRTGPWNRQTPPIGGVGEAEVAVPIGLIEEYCETLKEAKQLEQELYGGEIPEEYRELERPEEDSTYRIARHEQLRHIDDSIDEILDNTIKENFEDTDTISKDIAEEIEKLGSDYEHVFTPEEGGETAIDNIYESVDTCDIGKLKVRDVFMEKTEEYREKLEQEYRSTVKELATKERYDVPAGNVSLRQKQASSTGEIRQQINHLEQAIEALDFGGIGTVVELTKKALFGSWILPPTRDQLENKLQEARADLSELEQAYKLKTNMDEMVEYVDKKHAETKRELGNNIRDLYDMKNRLDELKYILSRGSTSTRLGYLPVNRETIEEDLNSEWVEDNINDIQDCFDNDLVEREDFEDAINRQLANSFPWRESSMELGNPNEIEGEYKGGETQTTWVFYHEDNEEITNRAVGDAADHETQEILRSGRDRIDHTANPFKVKIVSTYNTPHIDGLELYQDLDSLAESGTLGTFTSESPYDDWRQAFAYPEWYRIDPKRIFDGFGKFWVTLFQPPELDWKNDVDFSGIKQHKETYIKKYGLYEYLWQGARWDRYEGDDDWFEGWEETLKEEAEVTKDELSDLGPTLITRNRWISGTGDWETILSEFVSDDEKGGMIEKKGIDVEWDLPESQKPETLD